MSLPKSIQSVLKFNLQDAFFFLVLTGLSIAFYQVLRPFLVAIFAAVFLAHLLHVPYVFAQSRLKLGPRAASALVVFLTAVLILIPVSLVGSLVFLEAAEGYQQIQASGFFAHLSSNHAVEDALKHLPFLSTHWSDIENLNLRERLIDWSEEGIAWIARAARDTTANLGIALVQFVLTLYLMYFLLLRGKSLSERAFQLLPFPSEDSEKIMHETFRIVEATLIGSVIVGLLEGFLGGLVFYLAGIPGPVVWGVVMALFSMLPVVGASTILIPTGLWFLLVRDYHNAWMVLGLGAGGIGLTTGLLKPKLVGDRSGLHPAVVVLSTIGGLAWLGATGFFVGPLVAALCFMMWKQFAERYKTGQVHTDSEPHAPESTRPPHL